MKKNIRTAVNLRSAALAVLVFAAIPW